MKKIKVAINGFGRIGRGVFRELIEDFPEIEVLAINDLGDEKTMLHLLKYDSIYGRFKRKARVEEGKLFIEEYQNSISLLHESNPENLPWKKFEIDIILECTGVFTDYESAFKHLKAGAKKVIISAPSKNPEKIPSIVLGVNEEKLDLKYDIFDMGSCTTNCLAPVAKVLHQKFGIEKGFMSTIHAYTNDQRILDLPHKDLRRARAAALNIVPTTTGAARAIGNVIEELRGKLDGIAFRVPVPTVSVLDLICKLERKTDVEEINQAFKEAAEGELKGILAIEEEPLVSTDYIGNKFSAVVDLPLTMVIDDMVKVVAWYDNEAGYSRRLAEFTKFLGERL